MPVAYVTDVEGMWSKLDSFVRACPHVDLDAAGRLVVAAGATLVFGGDAVDRGPHGRRVVRTLLEAKERQPSQVVLLAGNRDINKLRLRRETAGHPPPWAPDDVKRAGGAQLLRWIFGNTMGAQQAFEHRRAELSAEGAPAADDDVYESYLADLAPDGEHGRYLARCQLAYRAGETLFLHGGITEDSLGYVPTRPRVDDVDAWIEALNGFYDEQLACWAADRVGPSGEPGWAEVVRYQAPKKGVRNNPQSVVYGRTCDAMNNPYLPASAVVDALARAGVRRVVVGHTPMGDAPTLLRGRAGDGAPFELLCADASHARHPDAPMIAIDGEALSFSGRAVLEGGEEVGLGARVRLSDDVSPVGLRSPESGHLVKARLDDGRWLLYRYHPGYRCEQIAVDDDALRGRPLVVPAAPLG